MAVRLDKEPVTPGAVRAGQDPVSLVKQDVTSGPISGPPPLPTPSDDGQPAPSHSGRRGRAGHQSPGTAPRHQFGRVALIAGFLAGALVAGMIGGAVANDRGNSAQAARAELAKARGELATAQQEEVSTQAELDSANGQLAELQARADDVADREGALDTQEEEARRRAAELDSREQQVAARETTVAKREAALKSYDVGHPLLDSIMDDGTWVVGRDIKPGTWRAFADDTGCTWSTSDGRSGQGDGTFHEMKVPLAVGQTFTVHGCTMWDTYVW